MDFEHVKHPLNVTHHPNLASSKSMQHTYEHIRHVWAWGDRSDWSCWILHYNQILLWFCLFSYGDTHQSVVYTIVPLGWPWHLVELIQHHSFRSCHSCTSSSLSEMLHCAPILFSASSSISKPTLCCLADFFGSWMVAACYRTDLTVSDSCCP